MSLEDRARQAARRAAHRDEAERHLAEQRERERVEAARNAAFQAVRQWATDMEFTHTPRINLDYRPFERGQFIPSGTHNYPSEWSTPDARLPDKPERFAVTVWDDSGREFKGRYVIGNSQLTLGIRMGRGRSSYFVDVKNSEHYGQLLVAQDEHEDNRRREIRRKVGGGILGCLFLAGLAAAAVLLIAHAVHHH